MEMKMFRKLDEHHFSARDEHAPHPGRPFFLLSIRDELSRTLEAIEDTQSLGAEIFAEQMSSLTPSQLHDLRQEARSIIEWLNTFLFHSE